VMADLSRSAQQVLDEAWGSPWDADDLDLADVEVIVAYALRAAALYCTRDHLILLALAEELEGRDAPNGVSHACLLELRARVELLEDAAQKHIVETSANILALASRVEALEVAKRPASKVYEINEPLKLTPEQTQQVRDLLAPGPRRNYPAKPDSSLVERVSTVIALEDEKHYWPEARDAVETDMARAAIREVALWLNEAPLDLYPHDRVTIVNTIYDQANQ